VVSAKKQLTMPPQKSSKKNVPTETDQEEHHYDKDNRISLTPEPPHTTDQERRAKLEALQKARAEKTAHALEPFTEEDVHEDDDQAVDRELEIVQQKIQQLQKEKERFANQLQAKRKASEKLEKLNQAKEQIERKQREIEEMKE
jgi:DNA repair exonuclease SbcCD ATPase subunit